MAQGYDLGAVEDKRLQMGSDLGIQSPSQKNYKHSTSLPSVVSNESQHIERKVLFLWLRGIPCRLITTV